MNERNLSRRLAASVVDTLKARGHILVVKGGATALARELDELMTPEITTIATRLKPRAPLVGEPTSTFGDETVDQAVEDMVVKLTHALMNSDHVEDVFAEDAVIRRDIFRVVRDGLREPPGGGGEEHAGHVNVTVKLDALGYVAATASRRADAATLRMALDRAASVTHARFSGFSPELREATFRLEGAGQDERLEIEEAVADELTDLVEQGLVELPTIERRVELPRPLAAAEQRTLRPRIDAIAEATLARAGCVASWEYEGPRTLRVLFTPLSEQDARAVDAPAASFAREILAFLEREGPPSPARAEVAAKAPPSPALPASRPRAEAPSAEESRPARAKKKVAEPEKHADEEERAASSAKAARKTTKAAAAEASPEPAPKRAAAAKAKATSKHTAESATQAAKAPAKSAAKAAGTAKRTATGTKATKAPAKKR